LTTSVLIELGLSLVGVGVLVAATYFLGAWRTARVTVEAAADRLAFDEPDFRPSEWLIGDDGKAAAAFSSDGAEIGIVFVMGDDLATRRLRSSAAKVRLDGGSVVFLLREPSRRAVKIAGADEAAAGRWLSRLGAAVL
jgi:hypothetical protein